MKLTKENVAIAVALAILFPLLILLDHFGLPHKWQTAVFATLVPFASVAGLTPCDGGAGRFGRRSRFVSVVHTLMIWGLFQYLLGSTGPGWLLWTPLAFVDYLVLFVFVKRLGIALTGKRRKNHVIADSSH